jgi:hypothetical protein
MDEHLTPSSAQVLLRLLGALVALAAGIAAAVVVILVVQAVI